MSWGWRYSGPGIVYCASISAAVTWWIGTRERPCGIRGGPRTGAAGSAISCGARALRICWPLGTGGLCTVKPFWWQNCGISGCGHLRKGICGPIISRWKRAGSTATRCFPIRRPFCGNLRNPIRPAVTRCRTESSFGTRMEGYCLLCGDHFFAPVFPLFPDASPAERRERSLGMVSSAS